MTDGSPTPEDPAAIPQPEAAPPADSAPAQAAPQPESAPPARPRPAYGELAPEGWEWKPEVAASASGTAPSAPAQGGSGAAAAPAASPTLPGVPHNLGANLPKRGGAKATPGARAVKGSGSGTPGSSSTGTTQHGTQQPSAPGSPYRAEAPAAAAAAPRAQGQQPGAPRPRMVDRIFTIGLLVIGAFSTLTMVSSLFALESQIRLTATMIGVEHATLAPWVGPLGTIGGIVVLALFAVTLIFSIQRMRAGKLAFWVPLTAGVIAVLIVGILPAVAMLAGAPEIMHQLEADPNGSLDKMLEYMRTMQP